MRYHFFLHYGWFFQNLGKEAVRTFMHTTVNLVLYGLCNGEQQFSPSENKFQFSVCNFLSINHTSLQYQSFFYLLIQIDRRVQFLEGKGLLLFAFEFGVLLRNCTRLLKRSYENRLLHKFLTPDHKKRMKSIPKVHKKELFVL